MVLKINQTYQPFVNSEECVGEKTRTGRGNVKKKERSTPPLLPTGNDESEPRRQGSALPPPWKKAFRRNSRWHRLVSGCGVMCARFWFQSHYNFQRCLVCTCLKKLRESAPRLSQRVVSKTRRASLGFLMQVKEKVPFCVFLRLHPLEWNHGCVLCTHEYWFIYTETCTYMYIC